MHHRIRRGTGLLAVSALALAGSGCFLQTISGATFAVDGSLITTVRTDAILTTCVQSGSTGGNVQCTYFFTDENGVPVDVTSSADLISEFGILGVVIDPLIYQIPADATDISGTYDDGAGNAGDLVILSGYRSIPIDIRRTLIAEPGTIFVIAELPDGVPIDGVQYTFELGFAQAAGGGLPVTVKPMLALKFSTPDHVFYPPMLPCEDTMAAVPGYAIDAAATLQPISVAQPVSVCTDEFYPLLGFGVFPCDFDADDDVDADDIAILASVRNSPALPGDRLDANADGMIDLNDARRCALQCLSPHCAMTVIRERPPIDGPMIPGPNPGSVR